MYFDAVQCQQRGKALSKMLQKCNCKESLDGTDWQSHRAAAIGTRGQIIRNSFYCRVATSDGHTCCSSNISFVVIIM